MRVSTFIDILEVAIEKYGDVEIKIYNGEGEFTNVENIVEYEDSKDPNGAIIICDKEMLESLFEA